MADNLQNMDQGDGDFLGGPAQSQVAAPAQAQAPAPQPYAPSQQQQQQQQPVHAQPAPAASDFAAPLQEAPMPPHLLSIADSMGVGERARQFKDPAALGQALGWLYEERMAAQQQRPGQQQGQQQAGPAQPQTQQQQQVSPAEAFITPDPGDFERDNYEKPVVGLVKAVRQLEERIKKLGGADQFDEFKKSLPSLVFQQVAEQQAQQQLRAVINQTAKELGYEANLSDPAFGRAFEQVANGQLAALTAMNRPHPDFATLARSVLPLLFGAPAAPAAAPPAQAGFAQQDAGRPRNDRGQFERVAQKPPIGSPTHRANGAPDIGDGSPLRRLLVDNNIPPGQPVVNGDPGDFLR